MAHAKFTVSDTLKSGPATALFDFFAECVASFCKEQNVDLSSEHVPMGFTFSFPVHQTSLNSGTTIPSNHEK